MRVPEHLRTHPGVEGGWTRLEVLGHMLVPPQTIISVFVRASLDGSYTGPGYQPGMVGSGLRLQRDGIGELLAGG